MYGTGRESSSEVRELLGGPPVGLRVFRIPTRKSESSRETLPEVSGWSGDPPGGAGVVERPTRRFGVVGKLSLRSGSGREALPVVRE